MSNETHDTLRDLRKPGFFQIDNEIVEEFELSPHEFAVYAAICYHASTKTQKAWPGMATIAKEMGMSRRKVIDCIKRLEELRIIDRPRPGYVYLVRMTGLSVYKIGLSKTPKKRIAELNGLSPYPIETICLIKTDDMRELETNLHAKYASKRMNGEWFELTDDDVNHIKGLAE